MIKKTTIEKSKAEYQAKIDAIPKPLLLVPYEDILRLLKLDELTEASVNKLAIYEYLEEKVVYRG